MSTEPIIDQRKEAITYLNEHKVLKLFEILGARLAKDKPDDPNAYIIDELEKITQLKTKGVPVTLFSEQDVEMMFKVFDLTNRGYITQEQYLKALEAVGIANHGLPLPVEDRIDKTTFVSHV